MQVDRYVTPDGALTFLVQREPDDITLGFDGYSWHTHADIIAELRGEADESSALQTYIDDLLHDRLPIVLLKKCGNILDVWVLPFPDDPVSDPYLEDEETLEVRSWTRS